MCWLTVLTAGVVMTSLLCVMPSGAFNAQLSECNRTAMTYVTDLDFTRFEGRWYVDYISKTLDTPYFATAYDVRIPVTPSVNNRGEADPTFMVIAPTRVDQSFSCQQTLWLYELLEGKWSNVYSTHYYPANLSDKPGYYVQWWDKFVLATDYNTTAVLWTEPILGGESDHRFGWIEVLLRVPNGVPNAHVVDQALNGFCAGDWLSVTSSNYHRIYNNYVAALLPCFKTLAQ